MNGLDTIASMQQASNREELLAELEQARQRVQQLEAALDKVTLAKPPVSSSTPSATARADDTATPSKRTRREWPLGLREYMRYGRQMMLPQIGLAGEPAPVIDQRNRVDQEHNKQANSSSRMHTSSSSEREDSDAPFCCTWPPPESVRSKGLSSHPEYTSSPTLTQARSRSWTMTRSNCRTCTAKSYTPRPASG